MTISAALAIRSNMGYIGVHASLVAATVGSLFLQRYIWLLNISEKGYGPFQSASYLIGVSVILVFVDVCSIILTLDSTQRGKMVAMAVPAAFLFVALFILIANST
jgi:hypothetical protein